MEDGESLRAAAVRELAEEIGLVVPEAELEGPVWLRRHVGAFAGQDYDSRETFFLLRDVVHEVDPAGRTELELLGEEPHRWWSRRRDRRERRDLRARSIWRSACRSCSPARGQGPRASSPEHVAQ